MERVTSLSVPAVKETTLGPDPGSMKASLFYRSTIWRLGMGLSRLSPAGCERFAQSIAACYWHLFARRRLAVINNLLPVFGGDVQKASLCGRQLISEFSRKLVDLWRYESGQPMGDLFHDWSGWNHFTQAQSEKKGVLLVTPHLGNWEFGAPLLARKGVKLLVITLAEPYGRLTELRQQARARCGIETLVIGRDPFAFVEIIRRLENGATVALLIDRPPASSAVEVKLFDRPFLASIAPAELARASGCNLLPVYLPRTARGYAAHILPMISYDRAELRSREVRQRLTQELMSAFEPAIREYPSQWYHFVPVWPKQRA